MKRIVYPKKKVSPMKKRIWKILLALLFVFLYMEIQPIRTMSVMEFMAREKLSDEPFYVFTDKYEYLYRGLNGPIVTDRENEVQFTWYKVLEWGDTASISAFVYKNPLEEFLGVFRKKNPSSVTANTQWYYVYIPEGISKFTDILPSGYPVKTLDTSTFKLGSEQKKIADSVQFAVTPERLLYFLKKGHFQVVNKQEKSTTIDFYQPIATIISNQTNDTNTTESAKIFIGDSSTVLIVPYRVPIEERK